MRAAILAIGSELLGTLRLDTNSLRLAAVLESFGIELAVKSVVADVESDLADEIRRRLDAAELVLVTGGLGPTADDVTRPAAARALGRGMTIDESIVDALRARYAQYGRVMPESNRQQGQVIDGAEILPNAKGTAPGMRIDDPSGAEGRGATLFLFPGPPRELAYMIPTYLEPWLRDETLRRGLAGGVERRVLKAASIGESDLEDRIKPAYERFGREDITVLAAPGEVQIHLRAAGEETARRARLDEMAEVVAELVGRPIFTHDADETLEMVVVRLLAEAGASLATAESCTGGLVAERLTRVSGSSRVFEGGVVTYSNALKTLLLGVPEAMLEEHGAVSEPVARAMAEGARARYAGASDADGDSPRPTYGVGITGVAGPGGGTEDKPVGTVHLAVAGPGGDASAKTIHCRRRFLGDRDMVRTQTAQWMLDMVRRHLLGLPIPGAS